MKITTSNLIRWADLSAVVGGFLFVGIQPIHPPEILASFTTSTWAIVHYVGVAMCFLILLGITGIYARQVEESGWLGLAGFLLLSYLVGLTYIAKQEHLGRVANLWPLVFLARS